MCKFGCLQIKRTIDDLHIHNDKMKKMLKKVGKMMKAKNVESIIVATGGRRIVISHDDVEDELLSSDVVRNLSKGCGINVGPFINGVAEFSWKLKPYKYSEPNYGVPDWERECIADAMIDANGKFLEKFQYTDYYGLKYMRGRAERLVAENSV